MKKKTILKLTMAMSFLASLSLTSSLKAQGAYETFQNKVQEEPERMNTFASYPDEVQKNILEAATEPQLLVKAQSLQENSKAEFRNLVSRYSQDEQGKIWNIVRYPDLVKELTQGGKKSSSQLKSIAARYPEDVRKDITAIGAKRYDTLKQIDQLYRKTSEQSESLLRSYPQRTQTAFRELLAYPEIISTMNADLNFTVLMGEAYRERPEPMLRQLRETHARISQENQEALEDWRRELANNPEAQQELRESATEFSQETGYVESNIPPPENRSSVQVSLNINAYPYWFGYPYWYSYDYWRPYPSWYHCGCYWGGDSFVVFGLPSYYYTSWYFYHPRHYYRHRHLSDYYVRHYYRHRSAHYGFHRAAYQWERTHQRSLNQDWYKHRQKEYRGVESPRHQDLRYRRGEYQPQRSKHQETYIRQKPQPENSVRTRQITREQNQQRVKTRPATVSPRTSAPQQRSRSETITTRPNTNTYQKPGMKSSPSPSQERSYQKPSNYQERSISSPSSRPSYERSGGMERSRSSFGGHSGGGRSFGGGGRSGGSRGR